ncbi:hypothetical protein EHQ24_02800 [Leptospira noumeaensis]|uniref:Uncharacterized protein n=1 Tax=Leptospira noumeaensis TaxID=2484964 RepID=A0A4R9IID0_9LEPT|nr:hypothetical protein [Leptospira noumeaensis]TGK87475.1 hypothetical protein EHQ24_02800 [Leptospira noumeaensis]
MRKFPKTLFVSISLEHLPMTEGELKQFCIEWEDSRFQNLRPAVVTRWKTETLALGKSKVDFELIFPLRFWDGLIYFFFPKRYSQKEKGKLTDILRNYILFKEPIEKPKPFKELWIQFWKRPITIVWLNLGFTKLRMELDFIPDLLPNAHPLHFDGEKKLYFRTGYLKTITYRFTKKEFKAPYPKFAEMYIKTKDKHSDQSFGKTYYSFLGYLLETKDDEYLLSYFGLNPILPMSIRKEIPNEIWKIIHPEIQSQWLELNLLGNELEFRTVYQVSTSSQNHLR